MGLLGVAIGTYRLQYRPLSAIRYLDVKPLPTRYMLFITLLPPWRLESTGLVLSSPPHVAKVCFNGCKCFRGMLQGFRIDVAKVDRYIIYVAMAIHICCKRLCQMFHLFQTYVASAFIWMLRICHTYVCKCFCQDVVYALQWLISIFRCFHKCFRHMFQVFHLSSDTCCESFIWIFQK
jgi:hypothetical protein